MRQELIEKIVQMLVREECFRPDMVSELEIILANYDITDRHTEVMVVDEDENQMLFRKFITAKIVKGLSERTLKYYRETIWAFFDRVQKNVKDVTADDIRLYIAVRLRQDKVSDTTAGNELRNLRSFYNWLSMEELIDKNPMAKIEPIKKAKTKKKAFTEYEVEILRAQCRTSRETAIVEVLLSTGCRVTELVNMTRSDIKGDSVLVRGKGNKDRLVYLNAKAMLALEKYMDERNDESGYLFPKGVTVAGNDKMRRVKGSWYQIPELVLNEPASIGGIEDIIRNIGKRAGVENTHPHRFRRTCATFALRRGMPIEQVSKMLGHEQLSTTQIYLDLTEEDLAQAHRKYVV